MAAAHLNAQGYRIVVRRQDAFSLFALLSGTSAGFIGDSTDSATRMAAALLIAEARGHVSHWSGTFPTLGQGSLLAAWVPLHDALLAEATTTDHLIVLRTGQSRGGSDEHEHR
jgi:fructose-1,6-bisphosphatase/inositol monophosphatase family enzyme